MDEQNKPYSIKKKKSNCKSSKLFSILEWVILGIAVIFFVLHICNIVPDFAMHLSMSALWLTTAIRHFNDRQKGWAIAFIVLATTYLIQGTIELFQFVL